MSSIHSIMLFALGFLAAALVLLLLLPLYRRRTARLATDALRRTLPVTEAEMRADKDRLRAEYAVRIHQLQARVEEAALAAARQKIELNRRDAAISQLEGEVARLGTALDEHENARRVLEQTITERLPKVEYRLTEARKLLFQRDREIVQLTQSAEKHSRALEDATQINTQQRDEIHRLNAALATRAARNRESFGDPRFDGEVALRSEIEALRDKTRDQAALIARLQSLLGRAGAAADVAVTGEPHGAGAGTADEIARLSRALAEAEAALKLARSGGDSEAARVNGGLEAELRALKAALEDKSAEAAKLQAALKAYETADDAAAAKDSRIAVKARLAALEAETGEQAATIQSLRAELAASNERLARQAQHFRDEMRRLGAGTLPTSGEPRRKSEKPARRSLAERIAQPRPPAGESNPGEPERVARLRKPADAPQQSAPPAPESQPPAAPGEGGSGASGSSSRRPRLLERIAGIDKPIG